MSQCLIFTFLKSVFFCFRAPTDCVQYFTGLNGNVYSYNHQGGQFLQNQDYNNCFRTEEVHALLILTYSTKYRWTGFLFEYGTINT